MSDALLVIAILVSLVVVVSVAFYLGWDRGHGEGFKDGIGRAATQERYRGEGDH